MIAQRLFRLVVFLTLSAFYWVSVALIELIYCICIFTWAMLCVFGQFCVLAICIVPDNELTKTTVLTIAVWCVSSCAWYVTFKHDKWLKNCFDRKYKQLTSCKPRLSGLRH